MSSIEMKCWCGNHYTARDADIKRGWGLSCSKSCAAIRRDYGKPKATRVDGVKIPRVKKKDRGATRITPDKRTYVMYAGKLVEYSKLSKWEREDYQHVQAQMDSEVGWDAHKDSF